MIGAKIASCPSLCISYPDNKLKVNYNYNLSNNINNAFLHLAYLHMYLFQYLLLKENLHIIQFLVMYKHQIVIHAATRMVCQTVDQLVHQRDRLV